MTYQTNNFFSGIGIQYDFLGAKYNNSSFSQSIGDKRRMNLSFSTELYPNRTDKGFFMSGQLGVVATLTGEYEMIYEDTALLTETGVLTESDDLIIIENTRFPLF